MSCVCLLKVLVIAGASARAAENNTTQHARHTFEGYKKAYKRTYPHGSDEHSMREELFNKRLATILKHNSRLGSWKANVNKFTDRTDAELQRVRGFKRKTLDRSPNSVLLEMSSFLTQKPQSRTTEHPHRHRQDRHAQLVSSNMSWEQRESLVDNDNAFVEAKAKTCSEEGSSCVGLGDVSCCDDLTCGNIGVCVDSLPRPKSLDYSSTISGGREYITDQGPCGSCWAIAAADVIGLYAARANPTFQKKLSPQGMLGCSPNPHHCGGDGGCDGSTPELAFKWAVHVGGIKDLDSEQYTAETQCPRSSSEGGFMKREPTVSVAGFVKLPENRGDKVMNALVTSGPLSVAVSAALWHNYDHGVFTDCGQLMDAHALTVDHAVIMMGYGQMSRNKYWTIRNSWGDDYGEDGFIRLARHAGTEADPEPCGWDHDPQKGVGCDGGPSKLRVCGECGVLSDVSYPVGVKVVS